MPLKNKTTVKEIIRDFQTAVNNCLDEIYRVNELHKSEPEHSKVYYTRKAITYWFAKKGLV